MLIAVLCKLVVGMYGVARRTRSGITLFLLIFSFLCFAFIPQKSLIFICWASYWCRRVDNVYFTVTLMSSRKKSEAHKRDAQR